MIRKKKKKKKDRNWKEGRSFNLLGPRVETKSSLIGEQVSFPCKPKPARIVILVLIEIQSHSGDQILRYKVTGKNDS